MRYLLYIPDNASPPVDVDKICTRTGLSPGVSMPSAMLFIDRPERCVMLGQSDFAIGHVFPRHGPARPLTAIAECDARPIVAARGHDLHAIWGGYILVLSEDRSVRIVRDPSGALPCYHAPAAGSTAFASDVELLVAAGIVAPAIDWPALGRHLYRAGLPTGETALAGVRELLPGFAVDIGAGVSQPLATWSPWDHATTPPLDPAAAAERLARTVTHCVRSWIASYPRLLVSVSGGLDSSIVAASLGDADALCLTMYGTEPSGDERPYARALCTHLGLPLVERAYRLDDIDIAVSPAAHLPRPIGRSQALAYERMHLEAARAARIDAFITGNGGDNVFGHSQSAAAIVDRYRYEGCGAGVVHTVADVCRQTGCSAFAAIGAAIGIARRPARYQWTPSPLFLAPALIASLANAPLSHPWLDAPARAGPGKAAHIAGLLRVQPNLVPSRNRYAPVIHPLLSQPVIEACLAIPSWHWRLNGKDRAVARNAFAERLPAMVTHRRTKGGPDGFSALIVRTYRNEIRDRLIGGQLADHGLLDRAAVHAVLGDPRPLASEVRVRILELVAAEAWVEAWSRRGEALRVALPRA
jgi:asparagine synthase (glutamine-hydrolysing)